MMDGDDDDDDETAAANDCVNDCALAYHDRGTHRHQLTCAEQWPVGPVSRVHAHPYTDSWTRWPTQTWIRASILGPGRGHGGDFNQQCEHGHRKRGSEPGESHGHDRLKSRFLVASP